MPQCPLQGSKSISKRRAEDEEQAKADRAAKRLRLEMKQRGHVVPKRRGEDPLADQREKVLQKTATRGVVRLFNAIAKAQRRLRQTEDATGSKAKAARLGKASFLSELRNSSKAPEGGAGVMSGQRPNAAADAEADDDGAGWEVLQKRFTGLQGGSKMKDWDKAQAEPVGGGEDEAADSDGDSSGDDGW